MGFRFEPLCPDPFVCTYGSSINQQENQNRLTFLTNYNLVLKFTSLEFDQMGKMRKVWYEIAGSQFQVPGSSSARVYALMETARIYLDDTIMPWYNNNSKVFAKWEGRSGGYANDAITT